MNKILILLATYILVCIYSIKSQTLYSTTPSGKNNGGGTIIKFFPAANNLIVAKSFETEGKDPISSLMQAKDGKLYGTTTSGGITEVEDGQYGGVIFSYDPSNSAYTILKEFDKESGRYPRDLMQASDGTLYGTTLLGGRRNDGVIFSYNPLSSTYTKLNDFDRTDTTNGYYPVGNLIQVSDGKLFGMTREGGSGNAGVIFSFDPSTSTYTKLKDFDKINGAHPIGSLIEASDGKLYGMTPQGGSAGAGVIFSVDPVSFKYTKLKDFDETNGADPIGSLMQASDGKLYGMTQFGGSADLGVIFSFDPSTSIYTKLRAFVFGGTNGRRPSGSLMQASDGKLYGMTSQGGSAGNGVIFSVDPVSFKYTKLNDFDGTNGADPDGSLMQASDGELYGMTQYGGSAGEAYLGYGVLFSFNPSSSTYTKLRDFGANENGSNVSSGFTQASDGKLYGFTSAGGSKGYGVIFSFAPSTADYKKLADFSTPAAGGFVTTPASAGLVQAKNGKLYGTTSYGGASLAGAIFSFDPSTSIYKNLKEFDRRRRSDGYYLRGSLMQASNEKLYGMAEQGGSMDAGVIFSFDPSTSIYKKLKNFDSTDGRRPSGSLMQAIDGKLYGMTSDGGSRDSGVIFSYDPSTSIYKKLFDFSGANGRHPEGSLMQATDGKLYGMTREGGSQGGGVIFSYDPLSSTYIKLNDFDRTDTTNGYFPVGNLMQASDGKIYGRTSGGGSIGYGVIFSYDPLSSTYTKLKNNTSPVSDFTTTFIEVKAPPVITLIAPTNNATFLAGGNVYLNATASDADGTITKVEFYNDTTLLYTATDTPYTFKWQKVKKGNYTVTAKATDNSGLVTTSAPVNISVVPNKPPTVSIITPANDQTFTTPANIHFEAVAADVDGRVTTVEFYNGSTLLALERKIPYTYDWANIPAGIYTITARATDNWGAVTISPPVTVTVTSTTSLVSSRPSALNSKIDKDGAFSLTLAPNPAKNIANIYTTGLQKNKQATLSVISATGVIMKTMRLAGVAQTIPLNVSSLVSGVYTVKLISGDKVRYGKFVKL